ncbi:hypothetical protein OU787_29650 [Kitasatospora sp. YST-16]|uniref:hypothetical protein n=1 Tax=Kitasatospora sp. YST-16 TaxID=2998080 RepID=UPI0022849D0B|nr:hypothetical protein [Kitasatospora sp. YST-16]WAL75331.1 hypothetical protein OU787_29650 [Kitasatospora sp. YST-16]
MNGRDRRHRAACPPPAAPASPHTPVTVVELDLADPGEVRSPGGRGPAAPDGRVSALVRLHGHPLGMVHATGTSGRPPRSPGRWPPPLIGNWAPPQCRTPPQHRASAAGRKGSRRGGRRRGRPAARPAG